MRELGHFFVANQSEILDQTITHLELTFISLLIAVLIGIPIGLLATRYERISGPVLGTVGVIQTIPSIALLGFMLPLLGIGPTPAITALFLYALLPIVRNTYSGINEVDGSVTEAARGMGLTNGQILRKVELPLAAPVIFAGIRTATVINVGVATLCALIGAGGLGEYIFRGIALNSGVMIMAGALPAALLAMGFDFILGLIERNMSSFLKPLLYGLSAVVILISAYAVPTILEEPPFRAGVGGEFLERADGFEGLRKRYEFDLPVVEMDASLMYKALKNGRIDVGVGYSTDGRIKAFNLRVLEDDKDYFPPYQAAPLVKQSFTQEYPEAVKAINKLAGKISTEKMTALNSRIDNNKESSQAVAKSFLDSLGIKTREIQCEDPDIKIGGKLQTEQFILAHIYQMLIENYSSHCVGLKTGLAGTKIVFSSLKNDEIQLYPEYTGTGLLVLLDPAQDTINRLSNKPDKVFEYIKEQFDQEFGLQWLKPIGFENTYALVMREEQAEKLGIETISDLAAYLRS